MSITVVTRWTTPNADESIKISRKAKAYWVKRGATDVRLSQIHTGPNTGGWIFAVVFPDWAAYAAAQTTPGRELQDLVAANASLGAAMHEREILVGVDL